MTLLFSIYAKGYATYRTTDMLKASICGINRSKEGANPALVVTDGSNVVQVRRFKRDGSGLIT